MRHRHHHHLCSLTILLLGVVWAAPPSARAQPATPRVDADAAATINTMCPVMPDEEVDPRFTVEYEGVRVGLCCRKCRTKFEKEPTAYRANLPRIKPARASPDAGQNAGGKTGAQGDEANDQGADKGEGHTHDGQESPSSPAAHSHDEHGHGTDEDASAEHDHAAHTTGSSRHPLIVWLGRFHPPATDIPIAMLLVGAFAEALFMRSGRERFRHVSSFCVGIAALGAALAVTLGWFNAGWAVLDEGDWVQTTHRWLGTTTGVLTLIAAALLVRAQQSPDDPRRQRLFRLFLFGAALCVAITGFFGGALVYGLDHYLWS